uniref:protein DBF4 homolog B isoform X2 n=1 Tax=Jaculus jaculus TaxID=51337 RepID=UPI001E1AFCA5|nr:protein DBF4 homolog B isoform X2 [Jaculus jaculus]
MAENRLPAPDPEAWLRVSSCPGRCQKSSRHPGKQPFSGKSFYLDLPAGKNFQFLTEAIQKLGGVPLSRGKELLQKAIRNQRSNTGGPSGSSSLLMNARSWGVKVLHVDEMMVHVQQLSLNSSCVKKQEPDKPQGTHPGSESRTQKVVRLKAPFLKIEDVSRKFRPSHLQFRSFPEISFLGPKDASPFEVPTTPGSSHHTRGLKDLKPCVQSTAPTTPRRRKGFCECCQVAFTELRLHLQSAQHQTFALDPGPYAEVDRIIAQLSHSFPDIPSQAGLPRLSGSVDSECDLLSLETPSPPQQLSHLKAASPRMKKEDGGQGSGTPKENRTVDGWSDPAESAGTGEAPGPEVNCQELEGPVDGPVDPPRIPLSESPACQYLPTSSAPMPFSDPDLALAGHKRKVQFHSGNAEKKPGPCWSLASVSLPRAPSSCSAKTTGSKDGLSLCVPGSCPWQPLDRPAELQTTQSPQPEERWPLDSKGAEQTAPDLVLEQTVRLPGCSPALCQPSAHLHSAAGEPLEMWSSLLPHSASQYRSPLLPVALGLSFSPTVLSPCAPGSALTQCWATDIGSPSARCCLLARDEPGSPQKIQKESQTWPLSLK